MTLPRPLGFHAVPPRAPHARYAGLGPSLTAAFGTRVAKIALDGGYTCPNRDGTLAHGGCSYCGEGSRGLIARRGAIARQFAAAVALRRETKFIAYFQAFTSTYAPLAVLRAHWREALAQPGVVGLALSTRPDCLGDDVVAELAALARALPVWVELGLESGNDAVLAKLNRAHDTACFVAAVERLTRANIACVAHLIFGLPQEPMAQALATVDMLAELPVWGLKVHPFHIVATAPIAAAWRRGHVPVPECGDYVAHAAAAVARWPADRVVHRLTGAAPGPQHLAPAWATEPRKLLSLIDAELSARGWDQGCLRRVSTSGSSATTAAAPDHPAAL